VDDLVERAFDHAQSLLKQAGSDLSSLPPALDNGGYRYFFESDWPGKPSYEAFAQAYEAIGCRDSGSDRKRPRWIWKKRAMRMQAAVKTRLIAAALSSLSAAGCSAASMRVGEYKCSQFTEYFYGKPLDVRISQFVAADLDKQYAIYICGNQYLEPPATYLAEPFAREGSDVVGFLKERLSQANDDDTIRDVVLVFAEMSRQRTYDVVGDGDLMRVIDDRVAAIKDEG
jgi:hypothetical protein